MDTTEAMIQGATAVIAFAALGLAIYEGRESRRHNRLLVKPELCIRGHLRGEKGLFGLSVKNDGIGPALITRCQIWVDGQETVVQDDDGWRDAFSRLEFGPHGLGYESVTSSVIPSGDRVWLLSVPPQPDTQEGMIENAKSIEALSEFLSRLRVTVSYLSLYREPSATTWP